MTCSRGRGRRRAGGGVVPWKEQGLGLQGLEVPGKVPSLSPEAGLTPSQRPGRPGRLTSPCGNESPVSGRMFLSPARV